MGQWPDRGVGCAKSRQAFLHLAILQGSEVQGTPSLACPLGGTAIRWMAACFRLAHGLARSGDAELKLSMRRSPSTPLRQRPGRAPCSAFRISYLVPVQKLRHLLGTALSRLCPTYGKALFPG